MRATLALCLVLAAGRLPAADLTAGEQMEAAIDRGDIQALKDLVEGGVDPDTPLRSDFVTTALMKAAGRGRRDMVKYLLAKGARVNGRDGNGQTPLMTAVTFGFEDIVTLLVAAGADVKARDTRGNSAFGVATFGAHLEIADVLLAHGADPNEADPSGITPLLGAASLGNEEVLRYLVAKGAKVNAVTQQQYGGSTALTTAASVGQVTSVKALLELGADPRLVMKDGGTALSHAQQSGNAEVVALIKAALTSAARPAPARSPRPPAPARPSPKVRP